MRLLIVTAMLGEPGDGSSSIYLTELLNELVDMVDSVAVLCCHHEGFGAYPFAEKLARRVNVISGLTRGKSIYSVVDQAKQQVEEALVKTRPDAVLVNNMSGLWSAVEALGASKHLAMGLIPYCFDLICPNVQLYANSLIPCEGPETPWKCQECVKTRLRADWMGRLALRMPAPWLERLRPESPWLPLLKDPVGFQERSARILRRFDRVFCPSLVMRDMLGKYGARPECVVHLPYGISDLRRKRTALPDNAAGIQVGYLGHHGYTKGFSVVQRAMAQQEPSRRVRMHVFNSKLNQNNAGAADNQDRWVWHPTISTWSITEAYDLLHAVVVPSLWHENSPFVVLEALANGRPVIASNVRGISEHVVHEKNGWLFPPGDWKELGRILREVGEDPGLIGQRANQCAYPMNLREYAQAMVKILS